MPLSLFYILLVVASLSGRALAGVTATIEHNEGDKATPAFAFKTIPSPAKDDAAAGATFKIIQGERDKNGGSLDVLHDAKAPSEADQPSANFFFAQDTSGGLIIVDLGSIIDVGQVNTYSWHSGSRAPQLYTLYAGDGASPGFNTSPNRADIAKSGWTHLCDVDTRPKASGMGGQYGVSITEAAAPLGKFRYLLFDISRIDDKDAFSNTFYSEIDVVRAGATKAPALAPAAFRTADNTYEFTIDSSQAPDLTEWATKKLAPVMLEWYPKIVAMLPSKGFEAPKRFSLVFQDPGHGVAATGGNRITCAAPWFRKNLDGEAIGAVVHEMVHVVQQYGHGRRNHSDAVSAPGWLTEGIPDYIRWYLYEPQSHGADHLRAADAKFDGSYRVSANFLNYVVNTYDKDIIQKLNTACREAKDTANVWKQSTKKTVEELGAEWKAQLK